MYRVLLVFLVPMLLLSTAVPAAASPLPVVRVAALKFGTVNWELDVIRRHRLDEKNGFRLEVIELISHNGSAVSLQGGAADIIVTDWLWVAHQYTSERYYYYFPYSTAAGELLVPGDSDLATLGDITGKSLGVAGNSEDKTWLLFRAYSREAVGYDLAERVEEHFATPPLLNGLVRAGRLDAVLTYWNFAASLKAQGYRSLLSMEEVLRQLGLVDPVPVLGWVFKRTWGEEHTSLVNAFLEASYEAKSLLLDSDSEWEALKPLLQPAGEPVFRELRKGYRQGVPRRFSDSDRAAIDRVSHIVASAGRSSPEGQIESQALPGRMFWEHFDLDRSRAGDVR